jgi:hypothetical protein
MVRHCNRTASAFVLADGQVLIKGCGALNRRLVHASVEIDIIQRSVRSNRAFECGTLGNVEIVAVFVDVVFDQRIDRPTFEGVQLNYNNVDISRDKGLTVDGE